MRYFCDLGEILYCKKSPSVLGEIEILKWRKIKLKKVNFRLNNHTVYTKVLYQKVSFLLGATLGDF
jgi:hypothetical protein